MYLLYLFLGTIERVCLVVGTIDSVKSVQKFIMDRIREKPDQHPKPVEMDGKVNQERHKQVRPLCVFAFIEMCAEYYSDFIKTTFCVRSFLLCDLSTFC